MQTNFNTRYHVMEISSVEAFMNVKGGCSKGCKDVYFLRITGVGRTMPEEIRQMDQILTERMNRGQGFYSRLNGLPRLAGNRMRRLKQPWKISNCAGFLAGYAQKFSACWNRESRE